ncbi:glycerol-3-phosphate 1-O-acyltransferase PlsY [Methylocapsa aurea]|uniref:glycerol-3-phosphate 1-O-acyltransferase PlsY n=1 Tax=Methylocapsa aurea TaxID=663610 RepID=UPI00055AFBDC|nr:glycerol-3-phosphate 1-O-acyltransferase PlsY [Methylocapsa aurea]
MALSAIALLFGYFCGSIPFGLILTALAGTSDLRSIGSGNIGATNVLRTGRKDLAALTLLLDLFKGVAAVLIVGYVTQRALPPNSAWPPVQALVAAFGAFLGHLFPIWLGFKGGKGVATFLGCLLALAWPAGLGFILIWLNVAWFTRFSSAAALAASALTPIFLLYLGQTSTAVLFAGMAIILWIKHRANIARIAAGTETKIGRK